MLCRRTSCAVCVCKISTKTHTRYGANAAQWTFDGLLLRQECMTPCLHMNSWALGIEASFWQIARSILQELDTHCCRPSRGTSVDILWMCAARSSTRSRRSAPASCTHTSDQQCVALCFCTTQICEPSESSITIESNSRRMMTTSSVPVQKRRKSSSIYGRWIIEVQSKRLYRFENIWNVRSDTGSEYRRSQMQSRNVRARESKRDLLDSE